MGDVLEKVGDELVSNCLNLACYGGFPGKCNEEVDEKWKNRKVTCGAQTDNGAVHQSMPQVAVLQSGNFIIVWQGFM